MNLLACPICKTFPLQLIVFNKSETQVSQIPKSQCEEFCGYKGKRLSETNLEELKNDCQVCPKLEIAEGILICQKCNRWYPIIEEIPHMLPDELRNEIEEKSFLKNYKEKIPNFIIEQGKPFNLRTQ